MTDAHQLAQANVSRPLAPLDSPQLADFVAALKPIARLADRSPGFVWQLQTDDGYPTAIRRPDDDLLIVNLSVWASAEALADFTYRSGHGEVMRRRRAWFEPMDEAHLVLWWVPAGHRPDVDEAMEHLDLLRHVGSSSAAFTFRAMYPFGHDEPISVAPAPGSVTLGRRTT